MAIKLQKEDALVIRITDLINSSLVNYNKYVNLNKDIKVIDSEELQQSSEEKVYRIFGEIGLRGFIEAEINNRLLEVYDFDSSSRGRPLTSFPEFSNQVDVAKKIVSRLKQLPERYRLTLMLPSQFSEPLIPYVASIKMGEYCAICQADRLPNELPLASKNRLINEGLFSDPFSTSMNTDRNLPSSNLYFTSVELGYVASNRTAKISEQFLDKVRAIFGALSAMGLLSSNFKSQDNKKPFVLIHRENDEREIVGTVEVADNLWERRWHQGTDNLVNGVVDKSTSIKYGFDRAALVLVDNEFGQRLATACIWFYRAQTSTNALDKILHATIAIEVLLGDREAAESVGLTKLLGNRCAYLLGKTRDQRNSIIAEFAEIYRVRSAIVHGGKHRLDKRDRSVSSTCLKLCASVIAKELELHYSQDLGGSI